jgi:hypothetical protein
MRNLISQIIGELGIYRRVAMPSLNQIDYIKFRLGLADKICLRYPNGGKLIFSGDSVKVSGLTFAYNTSSLKFVPLALHEIFIEGVYSSLGVRGRTVVDIGGSVGDTAAYFIKKRGEAGDSRGTQQA